MTVMKPIRRLLKDRWALSVIVSFFLAAIALQWNGPQSIAVADEVGYVTSGMNLVTTGHFTNPWGHAEVWFPPVYPVLIGLGSFEGWLDPFVVARGLSVLAAIVTLVALHRTIEFVVGRDAEPIAPPKLVATLTTALLAANPTFQIFANRALSESLALCLSVIALRVWLLKPRGQRGAIWIGVIVGVATLTRPECVLLAPLFCAIDVFRNRDRDSLERCLFCGVLLAATLFPYATYLHREIGHWTISHKGEVNLAAGRAAFHQTPREYIDEDTLKFGYFPVDTSPATEARRLVFNARKLVAAFDETYYRPLFSITFGMLVISGAVLLWRGGQRRLVMGLLAGLAYLGVVVVFDVGGAKNLVLALPTFSLLAAVTLAKVIPMNATKTSWARLGVLGFAALLMLEGATRFPRWVRSEPTLAGASLRETGLRLQATQLPRGVMYEVGASTAYYSGMRRRYLTPNSLDTILSYIERNEATEEIVYLTVSSHNQRALHDSADALLQSGDPRLEQVLAIDAPERVVVYRVKRS